MPEWIIDYDCYDGVWSKKRKKKSNCDMVPSDETYHHEALNLVLVLVKLLIQGSGYRYK